jgi:hypothetical protein
VPRVIPARRTAAQIRVRSAFTRRDCAARSSSIDGIVASRDMATAGIQSLRSNSIRRSKRVERKNGSRRSVQRRRSSAANTRAMP